MSRKSKPAALPSWANQIDVVTFCEVALAAAQRQLASPAPGDRERALAAQAAWWRSLRDRPEFRYPKYRAVRLCVEYFAGIRPQAVPAQEKRP